MLNHPCRLFSAKSKNKNSQHIVVLLTKNALFHFSSDSHLFQKHAKYNNGDFFVALITIYTKNA